MPSPSSRSSKSLLAVDTGGTFTDFYLVTPKGIHTHKVLSTPKDPAQAIFRGMKDMGLGENFEMVHGSTVATNAFLERKGAKVALITTAGFEDLIEIGRQNRPHLYELEPHRAPALVPRKNRYGLKERLDAKGKTLVAPLKKDLEELIKKIKKSGCEAVAVALLFSFRQAKHEHLLGEALEKLGLSLSLSSQICPEYREYERSSTTTLNAYVSPIMARYLGRLEEKLPGQVRVMQSNGGALNLQEASGEAVRTLLSGPAGGALGALQVGREVGLEKLITLDMGGTSTDMTLIDGDLEYTTEASLSGLPIKTPMIRIDTIGAGGGSLAWRDAGGSLRVGPQSAGADPGPICYGRGGKQVTLTDAHVFLGRIPPHRFLGGQMNLAPADIEGPLKKLAKALRLDPAPTAQGILTVANANMARALRVLSLERGYDPREFGLLCFGGAGALHACALAEALGIGRILIPKEPGILSAFGMARADWLRDYVKTLLWPVQAGTFERLKKSLHRLEKQAASDAKSQGFTPQGLRLQAMVDLRFKGQSYELTVPLKQNFSQAFLKLHRKRYGFNHQRDLEIVNLRLQARHPLPLSHIKDEEKLFGKKSAASEPSRCFYENRWLTLPVYSRKDLAPNSTHSGPAIITEFSATTFVAPAWKFKVHSTGHLIIWRPKP